MGVEMTNLKEEIKKVCAEMFLTFGDGEDEGTAWVDKVRIVTTQFYNVLNEVYLLVASAMNTAGNKKM